MTTPVKARVLITLRPEILDVQGQSVHAALLGLGYKGIARVRVGKLVELEMNEAADVDQMARELLVNPIIEDFKVEKA